MNQNTSKDDNKKLPASEKASASRSGRKVSFSIGDGANSPSKPFAKSPIAVPAAAAKKRKPASNPLKKRKVRLLWTEQEDDLLRQVVQKELKKKNGDEKGMVWSEIAAKLNTGRHGKQCRDRWSNYVRPGIKKGDWTRDEEELIKDMYQTFGPKWTAMSKLLKNRSDNDIKNKWYSMARKKQRLQEKLEGELRPIIAAAKKSAENEARAPTEAADKGQASPGPRPFIYTAKPWLDQAFAKAAPDSAKDSSCKTPESGIRHLNLNSS